MNEAFKLLDVIQLIRFTFKNKFKFLILWFVVLTVCLIYGASMPDIYKAEATLMPAESGSQNGGMIGGQLSGLASLAGVSFGQDQMLKSVMALEVLRSKNFLMGVIKKNSWEVNILAVEGWDIKEDRLIINSSVYDESSQKWLKYKSVNKVDEPSLQLAYQRLVELMAVSFDKKTNLIKVGIEYYSPFIAKEWVDVLVKEINYEIKIRDQKDAVKSIEYLKNELSNTALSEMKEVFYQLIEEQTKIIMFAEVRDEYVFKTIDSAIVPEFKLKPKKVIVLFAGLMMSVMSTLVVIFSFYIFFNVKNNLDWQR